jgi:hypothetical protein
MRNCASTGYTKKARRAHRAFLVTGFQQECGSVDALPVALSRRITRDRIRCVASSEEEATYDRIGSAQTSEDELDVSLELPRQVDAAMK